MEPPCSIVVAKIRTVVTVVRGLEVRTCVEGCSQDATNNPDQVVERYGRTRSNQAWDDRVENWALCTEWGRRDGRAVRESIREVEGKGGDHRAIVERKRKAARSERDRRSDRYKRDVPSAVFQ